MVRYLQFISANFTNNPETSAALAGARGLRILQAGAILADNF